ncbi:helix-turn-helix transcriptional regulator [Curtanaerobium respiraculi]|uniref:helix-turn-helix transcriptional regulator n=1 Tax=Curtanaerobium respiraculi TaxID=2949669 RepID=UPI0024B33CC1|nr:helix-turn-helix transcriptional regulator [Curtanaerobium respiraculi]
MGETEGKGLSRITSRVKWEYLGLIIPELYVWGMLHTEGVDAVGVPMFITMGCAMLLACALAKSAHGFLEFVLIWPVALFAGAGAIALLASPDASVLAGILAGIGATGLYLSWVPCYARIDLRCAVACIFSAMLIGMILRIPFDMLPTGAHCLVLALAPLANPLMLKRALANPLPQGRPPQIYFGNAFESPPLKILLGVAVCAFIIGIAPSMAATPSPTPRFELSLVHHLSEALAAGMILWWVFYFRGKLHLTNMWRAIVILLATSLFFMPTLGADWIGWTLVLMAVGQTLLVNVMLAMLSDAARHCSDSPYLVFGGAWIAYAAPLALGMLVGPIIYQQPNTEFLITLLAYALTLAAILTLNDRNFVESRIFRDLDVPDTETAMFENIDTQCDNLAGVYGLTGRETEVIKLLVKGRSKSYIAEELIISENTVRSHARHIYKKLDVHSKQDIMDLLMEQS